MMGWGVLWLTACLTIASRSHFLTRTNFNSSRGIIHQIITTEGPVNNNNATQEDNHLLLREPTPTLNHSYHDLTNVSTDVLSTYSDKRLLVSDGLQESAEDKTNDISGSGEGSLEMKKSEIISKPETIDISSEESNGLDASKAQEVIDASDPVQKLESVVPMYEEKMHETESNQTAESFRIIAAKSKQIPVRGSMSRTGESNNPCGDETAESCRDDDVLVQTTHGLVKGIKWAENKEILGFIDIPYGQIKDKFKAPQPAQSWIDIHEVQEHDKRCPQYQGEDYVGDLDCLTLSIFVPVGAKNAGVFFYVHDSSFQSGDPKIYGPEHLVPKEVILVLPNYRFGVLGFLCLQNEKAPGNAGLKDLAQALEWINDNIQSFGGNPSNIVVGGDGDAGALVSYLALCSRSKHYVHKVIAEGGSLLSHLALDRNPLETATALVDNIIKKQPNGTVYIDVFAEASLQTIVEASRGIRFNPCLERDKYPFLQVSPWKLLHDKEINTTFMIGSATYAGTHEAVATSETFVEHLNKDLGLILPNDLWFKNQDDREAQALRVKNQYFGNGDVTPSKIKELSLWSTDASYLGPLIRTARPLVQAGAKVYFYEFGYVGSFNRELISLNKPVEGAVRSDIIGYLFTQKGELPEEGSDDERIVNMMVELWVSFINTGVPTAEKITWNELKPTDGVEEEYLLISSNPQLLKGVHVKRLELWTELYNEYFIERNLAMLLTSGNYAFIVVIFWLINNKFDYNH